MVVIPETCQWPVATATCVPLVNENRCQCLMDCLSDCYVDSNSRLPRLPRHVADSQTIDEACANAVRAVDRLVDAVVGRETRPITVTACLKTVPKRTPHCLHNPVRVQWPPKHLPHRLHRAARDVRVRRGRSWSCACLKRRRRMAEQLQSSEKKCILLSAL